MKKIWTICVYELKLVFKKPMNFLLMIALPLLFTVLFGSLMSGDGESDKLTILFVDQDQTTLSKAFYKQIEDGDSLLSITKTSFKKAQGQLDSKSAVGAIILEKGFEENLLSDTKTDIRLVSIPELTSTSSVTQFFVNKLAKMKTELTASSVWSNASGQEWNVLYDQFQAQTTTKPIKITKEYVTDKGESTDSFGVSTRASGFAIMFVMITLMSKTGAILQARSNGVWHRLLCAPVSRFEIASGYMLSFFLIGWMQFGILIISTHYLFDLNWGDPLAVFVLVSLVLLAVVGIGLIIAGSVKTYEQQSSIGSLVIISTCMISGVYWPLEIEPTFMQKLADFLPQTWAMRGFTELITVDATLVNILDIVGIISIFAGLFLLVGIKKIRF